MNIATIGSSSSSGNALSAQPSYSAGMSKDQLQQIASQYEASGKPVPAGLTNLINRADNTNSNAMTTAGQAEKGQHAHRHHHHHRTHGASASNSTSDTGTSASASTSVTTSAIQPVAQGDSSLTSSSVSEATGKGFLVNVQA